MDKVTLQIPVAKSLRTAAEKTALEQGFSSLQEVIRVFMNQLAAKTIDISFQPTIALSPQAEKRYDKILKDIKAGKNVYYAKNSNDLMAQLNGNILPRKVQKKLS